MSRPIEPLTRPPDATVIVPGSKSHTNRALICAALAEGRTVLDGALFADDTDAMVGVLEALGVGVELDRQSASMAITGGRSRFVTGPRRLDARQSGTTGRFALAMAALGPGPYRLDGHPQLRGRPIDQLTGALRTLGASIDGDALPIDIGGGGFGCGAVALGGSVSSQFLSALLLAAPYARPDAERGAHSVEVELADPLVSKPYVDLTISTMEAFGGEVHNDAYQRFRVPAASYRPTELRVEPDASAASYFFAAAAITGGRVRIDGLGVGAVQGDLRFVDVLEQMGATVTRAPGWTEVRGPSRLRGVEVDLADMSDVAQTLAVTATFASGPTRVTGIGFIAKKEIDRHASVVDELRRRGIEAELEPDGWVIHPGPARPGVVHTYDDHRMAMSFSLLGLVHPGIEIDDPGCVAKTFPTYFDVLDTLR